MGFSFLFFLPQASIRTVNGTTQSSSYYKPIEVDNDSHEALLNEVKAGKHKLSDEWTPIRHLMHNRGILVLLNIIAQGATQRTGAAETAKYALDSLEVATLVPVTLTETCLAEAADNKTGTDGSSVYFCAFL